MHAKQLVKKSIIVGFIFLVTFGLIFPSTGADLIIDGLDGVWSDSFDDADTVNCTDCTIDEKNGTITLNRFVGNKTYDFAEKDFQHQGSAYRSFLFHPILSRFLSPTFNINIEQTFDERDYDNLISSDGEYAERSSSLIKKYIVHHFRFKVDVDEETIGGIEVNWHGKVVNADSPFKIYLWKYQGEGKRLLRWSEILENETVGSDVQLKAVISKDVAKLAVIDNYIDICIVAHAPFRKIQICTISTDYVNISSSSESVYDSGPGIAITNVSIDPKTISSISDFYWDILTWEDYEGEGSSVKYQVLYKNETGHYPPVEDNFLAGNEIGFTESPVHLNNVPYDILRIKANLTTENPSVSPKLYSWTLTWQTNSSRWQDLFKYDYRIDTKNRINLQGGTINISSVQGEWPMFGFNAQNNRATEGDGPDSGNLYWYTRDEVGGGFRNPVIGDGCVYIADDQNQLYKYDILSEDNSPTLNIVEDVKYLIMNSPVVTEDNIIVATGNSGENPSGRDNIIRAYNKDLDQIIWTEEFSGSDLMCFYSSPVVADGKLFISSWNGDTRFPYEDGYNRVVALDVDTGDRLWDDFPLPSGSYSTPAIYNNKLIVGCKGDNKSLFAIRINDGTEDWSKSVGSIGQACPVVYGDFVYVMSKSQGQLKLTALNAEDGDIRWTKMVSALSFDAADITPAIYNDILYVATPYGRVYAYNVKDGTEPDDTLWEAEVYKRGILDDFLSSSPVYADGQVFIGTPEGKVYSLDALTGNKTLLRETFTTPGFGHSPVISSPIISNGLLFVSDEHGVLYSIGTYKAPEEEIEGSLISIPIRLPTGSWWKNFYVSYNATAAGNDIKFSLLDKDKNFLKTLSNESRILLDNATVGRTIRLKAELSADNISVNPELYSWYVTFEPDHEKPVIALDTFYPAPDGWLNEMKVPVFTVEVKDNETGLNVDSAKCTLKYKVEDGTDTQTFNINCTGEDGTPDTEVITANITSLDIYENITELVHIEISISDLAGNENSTGIITFKQDVVKPESEISNETNDKAFNTSHVVINATANDRGVPDVNASGVALVELRYRHSLSSVFSGPWELYDISNVTTPSWNFTDVEGGGYYELATIATDVVGNVEDEPDEGDVTFILDPNAPSKPILEDTYWFNSLPEVSIEFADDFKLDKIEYRPNFEPEWTVIDSNVGTQIYDDEWDLSQDYWDQMVEGEEYSLYFRLTDTLGNVYTSSVNDALKISKDETAPHASLEIPELETEWSWYETFDISAFATDGEDGSGIKTVELYYRYSEDNETWSEWTLFGDSFTSEPYEWQFIAEKGDGHYEFKIVVEDVAGNVAESSVFATGLNIFHLYLLAAMVSLLVALILIIIILFIKWKKIE